MNIFISHSSRDSEIAQQLERFLESINVNINVFCTSSFGTVSNGRDFVEAIEENLEKCDQFICLLSKNYISSKFCMIELGYAYAKLVHSKETVIKILTLPGGEGLLEETPLSRLQYYPLFDIRTIKELEKDIKKAGVDIQIDNDDIRSFSQDITSSFIKNADIFEYADLISCCSNPLMPNAVKSSRSNGSVIVNYNLSGGWQKKPMFISSVFYFYNDLDLLEYYLADNSIKLHCVIDNYTESIRQLQIEFQTYNNKQICKPFEINLNSPKTTVDIPISYLSKYRKDLRSVVNICFVAKGEFIVEEEGTYIIEDLRIQ